MPIFHANAAGQGSAAAFLFRGSDAIRVRAVAGSRLSASGQALRFAPCPGRTANTGSELGMRAEIEGIVEEIKQSARLLRRHL
jgi:hypothetical protein